MENKKILIKKQDVLWWQYQTLMAKSKLLISKIEYLRLYLTEYQHMFLINSPYFLQLVKKEQEILFEIKNAQKQGRKRFYKYFDVEETNKKMNIHILLKTRHLNLLKEFLSYYEGILKSA